MGNNLKLTCINRCKRNSVAFTIFLLCMFAAAPVFGQGGAYCYTDSWADEYDIYGCGVMEDAYVFPQHQFSVTTTLTRPDGNYLVAGSGFDFHYVRVDIETPIDMVNFGDYFFSSEHQEWCPYLEPEVIASTFALAATGQSQAIYKVDFCTVANQSPLQLYCEYVPIPGCMVNCMPSPLVRRPTIPPDSAPTASSRIVRLQSWVSAAGALICLPGTVTEIDAPVGTPLPCAELP